MNTKNILISLIFIILAIIIFAFRLKTSLFYHPDFARDVHEILKISQGKFTLIGPKLTFGGLYIGPYYYYLYVPAYILSGGQIISVHFFNVFLFALAIGYFLYKVIESRKYLEGVVFSVILLILPLSIVGARNPSNAYSFIPLFLVFLTYIYFTKSIKAFSLMILGFLYGVIVNFHFINAIFFPFLIFYLWLKIKDKKQLIGFLLGIGISFLPLLLFEIKHNFVMIKNTFIDKSYLKWLTNTNIPNGISGKKNVLTNLWFLSESMKTYLLLNPLLFYFVFGIIFYFRKPDQKIKAIYFGSLLTLFFAAVILRFQFIPHYLFALAFYLFFNAIVILLSFKQSFLKVTLIISFILLELIYFPRQQYFASWRSPERFEKAVAFVINKNLVSKTNFNVLQITQENLLATIGYEYRYFFRKNGYLADSEFLYSHSKELVVFSEVFYKNINQFNSWEAEQFGKKYFKNPQRYQLPGLTIFVLQKGREGEIEN